MQQQTPEWFAARRGKVTASRINAVMMSPKSQGYQDYLAEVLMERFQQLVRPQFLTPAMEWGNEQEPIARAHYHFQTGRDVKEVGFVRHAYLESGASPDGYVGNDGLIEIKCPNTITHIKTLLGKGIRKEYLQQIQWQLACTGCNWCDFVSFDPRVPTEMQLIVIRVERDDEMIEALTQGVANFLAEVGSLEAELHARLKIKPDMEFAMGVDEFPEKVAV